MFKHSILFLLTIASIYLIINVTILSKDEKPKVNFELADKTIPYKILNYSFGKVLDKDKLVNEDVYSISKEESGTTAFKGDYVHIHFSERPENIEILEHTKNKKSYIYDYYTKNYDSYSFQIGTQTGYRIFEVKSNWKGNNYVTYLLKLKIM